MTNQMNKNKNNKQLIYTLAGLIVLCLLVFSGCADKENVSS
jgi:hypothetical protein